MKKAGSAPEIITMETGLDTWQAIVGGHVQTIYVGSNGAHRLAIICNEDGASAELPNNLSLDDGRTVVGDVAFVKVDAQGKQVSMSDEDCALIVEWIAKAEMNQRENQPEIPGFSPPAIDDTMQVILLPRATDVISGEPVAPEETMARLSKQWDRECLVLSPAEYAELYAAALNAVREQGHACEIADEKEFLLSISMVNKETGETVTVMHYLRVVKWTDAGGAISTPIRSHRELADLFEIGNVATWPQDLAAAISEATDRGCWLNMLPCGIEIGAVGTEPPGYPLDYPFAPRDLYSLIAELDRSASD